MTWASTIRASSDRINGQGAQRCLPRVGGNLAGVEAARECGHKARERAIWIGGGCLEDDRRVREVCVCRHRGGCRVHDDEPGAGKRGTVGDGGHQTGLQAGRDDDAHVGQVAKSKLKIGALQGPWPCSQDGRVSDPQRGEFEQIRVAFGTVWHDPHHLNDRSTVRRASSDRGGESLTPAGQFKVAADHDHVSSVPEAVPLSMPRTVRGRRWVVHRRAIDIWDVFDAPSPVTDEMEQFAGTDRGPDRRIFRPNASSRLGNESRMGQRESRGLERRCGANTHYLEDCGP